MLLWGVVVMEKMLIVASRLSHIVNFHLPYIQAFREAGWQVDVAAEGTVKHPLLGRCYDMHFVKNPLSVENWKTIRQLTALLRENHYTLVYSNATLAGFALRMAVKRLPQQERPRCVHISHGYMFDDSRQLRSRVYRMVEKHLAKVTDTLVVMNHEDEQLARRYHLSEQIVFTHGMGLCGERFPSITQKERQTLRQQYGADEDTMVLLCVGEFSARKNQALLIEALNRLPLTARRRCRLLLAGQGATQEACQQLTARYELQPFVHFLGQVAEPAALYRCADVLVSAATMEGLPFNVMEALYCGIPVVASRIKGHTDLLTDGDNGLLFDIHTDHAADRLTAQWQKLLNDHALYQRLKDHAVLPARYQIEHVRPYLYSVLSGGSDTVEIPTPEVTHL